jgi:UDP-N-acetylglucosamine 2-epimerase (non-hydrolysing)
VSKVSVIFGTRPEAIKLAPVIRAARGRAAFETVTCVTAQHRQMLDQILGWFQIVPDHDLNLMQPDQTLSGLTARAMEAVTQVIEAVRPDMVIVQGDTTTAMTAALAAFYQKIPVGHVEAGLRTYDRDNPFPEEVNRHLISVLAAHHFAPTKTARKALLSEGTPAKDIHLTGNTVIDALQWTVAQPYHLDLNLPLDLPGEKLILVTGHRRESFGSGLESICTALRQIAVRNPEARLIYPVHLNPQVREPVYQLLGGVERIHLIDPLPYPAFAHLMARCHLILTDSGGVQEEAPSLGKPVLVMRRTTERPEAVEAGTARLVGTDAEVIVEETERLLHDPEAYGTMANAISPFGDGHAGELIADTLAGILADKAAE